MHSGLLRRILTTVAIPASQGLLTGKTQSARKNLSPRIDPPMTDAPHHHNGHGSDEHAGRDEHEVHSPEMFREKL
jgi:hypothetical protein